MEGTQKLAFSKGEAARALGVSRDSVTRAIAKGTLKAVKFGRRILIPKSSLEEILRV